MILYFFSSILIISKIARTFLYIYTILGYYIFFFSNVLLQNLSKSEFIFCVYATGTRYLARALNDPTILAKMAWFALKGEEALDSLSSYYKNQIEQYSKDNYKKGFEDGKNGKQTKQVSTPKSTVVKNNNKSNKNGNERENPKFIPLVDTSRYMIDLD